MTKKTLRIIGRVLLFLFVMVGPTRQDQPQKTLTFHEFKADEPKKAETMERYYNYFMQVISKDDFNLILDNCSVENGESKMRLEASTLDYRVSLLKDEKSCLLNVSYLERGSESIFEEKVLNSMANVLNVDYTKINEWVKNYLKSENTYGQLRVDGNTLLTCSQTENTLYFEFQRELK